jgi:HCOMODA/2-hydroxy-3-carboxy-muconic semialdehyde decarboxylase
VSAAYPEQSREIRIAARSLGRAGLVHAYGHCSLRLDADTILVSPSRPLGMVAPGEDCLVVPLDGPLPEGVLGEVRVHRAIYRRRPDVGGIVRAMPPNVMTLAAAGIGPRARHGFGAYFHPAPPVYGDPQLLRSDAQAEAAAACMGDARAVLMRGNGCVVAGASLAEAVVLTWYLEDAARVELAARAAGLAETGLLDAEQAQARATWSGQIRERMWDYLAQGDPEAAS